MDRVAFGHDASVPTVGAARIASGALAPLGSAGVDATLTASGVGPFEARFEDVRRFAVTGVVYLAPEPRDPFDRLIAAFVGAFPEHPPYSGSVDEPVPHLTVSDDEGADPDDLEAVLGRRLPVVARIREVSLMADSPTGWETLETFPLR